jgi:putative endonuclease
MLSGVTIFWPQKQREMNMKHWPRAWKVRLIHRENPDWGDLYDRLL